MKELIEQKRKDKRIKAHLNDLEYAKSQVPHAMSAKDWEICKGLTKSLAHTPENTDEYRHIAANLYRYKKIIRQSIQQSTQQQGDKTPTGDRTPKVNDTPIGTPPETNNNNKQLAEKVLN